MFVQIATILVQYLLAFSHMLYRHVCVLLGSKVQLSQHFTRSRFAVSLRLLRMRSQCLSVTSNKTHSDSQREMY
ncbi:hypothetical protein U0070_006192 [Myodes glareolus]|uniref:Secreted protein n=1 Tax=Myodes glareolus TaxID=447135 RepID=A0AAW0HH29_MYOGA